MPPLVKKPSERPKKKPQEDGFKSADNPLWNVSESADGIFETLRHLVGEAPVQRRESRHDAIDATSAGAAVRLAASTPPTWLKLYAAIADLRGAQAIAFDLALNRASIDLPLDIVDPAIDPAVASDAGRTPVPAAPDAGSVTVVDGAALAFAATNVINMHRGWLCAVAEAPRDRMKIDIVSMLFDHILADDKVPAAIRGLLARLQWPVLRIALGDASFFATRAHPARRLMDRIASCAVGWRADSKGSGKLFVEIERIVRTILKDTSDDGALYERLRNEFERFLDAARNASGDLVCRAADVLERVEEREVLTINATIQVNQFLYGITIEPFLRSFLLDVWSRVLVEMACRATDPKTDAAVARAKRVCLDLVWSVTRKTSDEDRQRLGALWPKLSATIRSGLALIGYPAADEARFFAQLTVIHPELMQNRVVNGALPAPQSGHAFASKANRTEHTASDFDGFAARLSTMAVERDVKALDLPNCNVDVSTYSARRAIAASDVPIDIVTTSGTDWSGESAAPITAAAQATPAARAGEETVASWIDTLEKGSWLEIRDEDGVRKIRLAWISPMKSFYLFISADGQRAHSLDRATLDAMFTRRDLRVVEDEPLVDRAVRGVMVQLEPKPSAAGTR